LVSPLTLMVFGVKQLSFKADLVTKWFCPVFGDKPTRMSCKTYLMAAFIHADITAIPNPLPATMNISTNSLFRLKYCATISVEQSRVKPTPIPVNYTDY